MPTNEKTRIKDISPFKEMIHDILSREVHSITVQDMLVFSDPHSTHRDMYVTQRKIVKMSATMDCPYCLSSGFCYEWTHEFALADFRKYYESIGELELFLKLVGDYYDQ